MSAHIHKWDNERLAMQVRSISKDLNNDCQVVLEEAMRRLTEPAAQPAEPEGVEGDSLTQIRDLLQEFLDKDAMRVIAERTEARDSLARENATLRSQLVEREEELGRLKANPSPGLLVSMALRFDHSLCQPGSEDRLRATMTVMEQLYQEVVGGGFYSPDKEESYAKRVPPKEQ